MESLKSNKPLLYSILGSSAVVLALTLGVMPEISEQLEIISFPDEVINILCFLNDNLLIFMSFFSLN